MKNYIVKTNDFKNIQKIEHIKDEKTLAQIEQVENLTGDKIIKNLNKGQNSVLMIAKSGKYYVTARPCYIPSLVNILDKAGINPEQVITLRKTSGEQVDLTPEQVKAMLIA